MDHQQQQDVYGHTMQPMQQPMHQSLQQSMQPMHQQVPMVPMVPHVLPQLQHAQDPQIVQQQYQQPTQHYLQQPQGMQQEDGSLPQLPPSTIPGVHLPHMQMVDQQAALPKKPRRAKYAPDPDKLHIQKVLTPEQIDFKRHQEQQYIRYEEQQAAMKAAQLKWKAYQQQVSICQTNGEPVPTFDMTGINPDYLPHVEEHREQVEPQQPTSHADGSAEGNDAKRQRLDNQDPNSFNMPTFDNSGMPMVPGMVDHQQFGNEITDSFTNPPVPQNQVPSIGGTSEGGDTPKGTKGRRKHSWELDPLLWTLVPRGARCYAEDCTLRDEANFMSKRRHYHATCNHYHDKGVKDGMIFHHHQLEKIKKHQMAHNNVRDGRTRTAHREVAAIPPPPAPTPVADNLAEAGIERHDPNKWTSAATRHLDRLVFARGDRMHCSWVVVADALNEMVGRQAEGEPPGTMILAEPVSPTQCLLQWRLVVNNDDNVTGVNTWSTEEDTRLSDLVGLFGLKWSVVAQLLPGREAKQCRERFLNVIDPGKVKQQWSQEEDNRLKSLMAEPKKFTSATSKHFSNRSYNEVKSRYLMFVKAGEIPEPPVELGPDGEVIPPGQKRPKSEDGEKKRKRKAQQQQANEAQLAAALSTAQINVPSTQHGFETSGLIDPNTLILPHSLVTPANLAANAVANSQGQPQGVVPMELTSPEPIVTSPVVIQFDDATLPSVSEAADKRHTGPVKGGLVSFEGKRIDAMSAADLKTANKAFNLQVGGKKEELHERLRNHILSNLTQVPTEGESLARTLLGLKEGPEVDEIGPYVFAPVATAPSQGLMAPSLLSVMPPHLSPPSLV